MNTSWVAGIQDGIHKRSGCDGKIERWCEMRGTRILVFVAFWAQSGGKLCKRCDFMKPS